MGAPLLKLNHFVISLSEVWLCVVLVMVSSVSLWSLVPRVARSLCQKLRGQRAKAMKFVYGLMIHSGDPCNDYVDTACRHVLLRQGVLGIKVKIMLPWDPTGKMGPKKPLPDHVSIVEPKDEHVPANPYSESKGAKAEGPM